MAKMRPEELVAELNEFAKTSDPQTEDTIVQLYFHYVSMFEQYCGIVPNFEIVDNQGTVKLIPVRF